MLVLLLIVSLFGSSVLAQEQFRVFRGATEVSELQQFSDVNKLQVAAKYGESYVVELTNASQAAVAQEDVSLSLDCLPWQRRVSNGSIESRWLFVQLEQFSGRILNPEADPTQLAPNDDMDPPHRIIVGGDSNRWLNITRVVLILGAEDPDSKIFMCQVCEDRDTPTEICHTSNFTLRVIGVPPTIVQNSSDICLSQFMDLFQLGCSVTSHTSQSLYPIPQRSWFRNDALVYTANVGDNPDVSEFVMNNTILMLGVLEPQVFTALSDGSIRFFHRVFNITTPSLIPDVKNIDDASNIVFNLMLGTWVCTAVNNLGNDSVTYTVRKNVNITGSQAMPSVGKHFTLTCNICDLSPNFFVWRKCNSIIQGESNQTLSFSPFQLSDAGSYTCEVSTDDYNIESDPMNVGTQSIILQPTVNLITDSPNPILSGSSLTLTCSVEFNEPCSAYIPVALNIEWTGPDKTIIATSAMEKLSSTRYLRSLIIIEIIEKSDAGTYICTVSADRVTKVSSRAFVTIVHGLFQLSLKTVNICEDWHRTAFSNAGKYSRIIKEAVTEAIERRCKCNFPTTNFPEDTFRCVDSPHLMTYRSTLTETYNFNGSQIIKFIQDWVNTGPSIKFGGYHVRVQSNCPVLISSMDELECQLKP